MTNSLEQLVSSLPPDKFTCLDSHSSSYPEKDDCFTEKFFILIHVFMTVQNSMRLRYLSQIPGKLAGKRRAERY